jgi:Cys-tRNA(Pro)/Cys-tRNA(Cys) deacylase
VAQAFGWPGCELVTAAELKKLLGVSPRGVSPLGLGPMTLLVDESLFPHGTMLVGGGAGIDIELDPRDLVRVTNAKVMSIAVD